MSLETAYQHKSVLLEESIKALNIKADGIYLDGTTGGAGHSKEIFKSLGPEGHLICLDKDDEALEVAKTRLRAVNTEAKLSLFKADFRDIDIVLDKLNIDKIDGVILDLGLSSWQVDTAERGFSYMQAGPLDMRMDQSKGETAAQILARIDADSLADILYKYGEEKNSRRIARAIVDYREEHGPISTTTELADIIIKAQPARSRRENKHPAKRSFQALRIYVNGELSALESFLDKIIYHLNEDARVAIISFHSLEDRIVKHKFRHWEDPCECPSGLPCVCGKKPLGKTKPRKGITASKAELNENPRARSARLRVFIRNSQEIV